MTEPHRDSTLSLVDDKPSGPTGIADLYIKAVFKRPLLVEFCARAAADGATKGPLWLRGSERGSEHSKVSDERADEERADEV